MLHQIISENKTQQKHVGTFKAHMTGKVKMHPPLILMVIVHGGSFAHCFPWPPNCGLIYQSLRVIKLSSLDNHLCQVCI